MKILITGSNGFIGKNLSVYLKELSHEVLTFKRDDSDLFEKINQSEFIFHLAGVNRPKDDKDFYNINVGLTEELIEGVKKTKRNIPILFASSTQVLLDNPYGVSKKQAEDKLLAFHEQSQNHVYILRLPGVFGKWSKPYYNTVVATFIHQMINGESLTVTDPEKILDLVYVEDLMQQFISIFEIPSIREIIDVDNIESIKLGELAKMIQQFKQWDETLTIPNLEKSIDKKLYSTYISMKSPEDFLTHMKMHIDERGSFTELIKSLSAGQVSINIAKPGIEKGNHYHHHKHEKFVVVSGHAEIKLRKIGSDEITTIYSNGDNIQSVDIPPGYVHSISNVGYIDLITLMWANEIFDPTNPDTIYQKV